jgi:1,4-alpha-glucan branching enzyme
MLYLDYSRQPGQWVGAFGGRENLDAIAFLQTLNGLTYGTSRDHDGGRRIDGVSRVTRPVIRRPGFTFAEYGMMHRHPPASHEDPIHRRWHHNLVTFTALYMHTENFILPFSHERSGAPGPMFDT